MKSEINDTRLYHRTSEIRKYQNKITETIVLK